MCSCSLVPNSIKQSISHPVYNLKMVVKVTRDDQQSHYTRFGVTLNWQRTYKRERKILQLYESLTLLWTSSRLRWRIWQWKWRNSSTSLFRLREEVFNTTSLRHEENGDKRRNYQICAGRSIELDTGNSDSDGFLCEDFICHDRMCQVNPAYNRNQVGDTNVFSSLQVI